MDRSSRAAHLGVSRALVGIAILAALAVGLLLSSVGPLQAQEAFDYPENGKGVVATFTATDPEEKDITWSLNEVGGEDFKITDGVLEFRSPPDFESPSGGLSDDSNTYEVTVVASAGASTVTAVQMDEYEVTVEVTNVEEHGSIMLSTLQPQVGVQVTATLNDEDVVDATSVEWQWYRGSTEIPGAIAANFTPSSGDVGYRLVVKASYDDAEGDDRPAEQTSVHPVRAAPASNITPVFPDEAVGDDDVLIMPREVDENTASGENIGAPIAATDPGDVLTYAFEGTTNDADEGSFDIDRATGQLITKAALNHEGDDSYTVTVTATDPFGVSDSEDVIIQVADLNEAPTIDESPAAAISFAEDAAIADELEDYAATDQDEDETATLTWSLTGADAGKFNIGNQAGGTPSELTFKAQPNYESPGDADGDNDYKVTVVVSDGKGNSDEHDVTISVTNVEEDGTVTISTLQPRVGVELSASLTDPDGDVNGLMWQWYRDGSLDLNSLTETECDATNTDNCLIKDAASAAYTPVAGDINRSLNAVATYKDGSATNEDMAFAEAAAVAIADRRPKAPEFEDQDTETDGVQTDHDRTVAERTQAGLPTPAETNIGDPIVATDPNPGDTLTYTLGGTDAASFGIVAGTGQLQTKAALDHETKDSYSVTVTATDSLQLATTINVTIEVNDVDEEPDLDGDSTASYVENGTGEVATYTATDPEDKDIVWTVTGTHADEFSIEGGVLEFDSPPDFEDGQGSGIGLNEYVVTVNASAGADDDAAIKTATQEVTVTVTDEEEPGSIMLSTLQPQVGEQVTATLTDGDTITASTVKWQWLRGSTPINGSASTGAVTATYTPIDGDVGNRLRAKATYDDSEGEDKSAQEDSARSTRRAPSSNFAPVFPDQNPAEDGNQTGQDREIPENTPAGRSIGAPVRATDPGEVLTYSLAGTSGALFDIDRATGQLRTKEALDHETGGEYEVTVTAADPFGATADADVTIKVTDVNEDPTFNGSPEAVISFEENDTTTALPTYPATDVDADEQDTLEWSLEGDDAGDFEIASDGVLTWKSTPNYESPADADGDNDYNITIVVTDAEGNTDEHDVTVTVTNEQELGTVTFSTLQPRVGVELTATLTDADLGITDLTWQWLEGGTEIGDATSATYTPGADDIGDVLTATATYKDGESGTTERTATANTGTRTVIADIRNKAPVFPDQDAETEGEQTDQKREVPENYVAGQSYGGDDDNEFNHPAIGAPVTATDNQFATVTSITPDPDTLTYTLGGADAASFNIVAASGQLQTKAALDHEDKDTYTVTVTATDPSGLSATVTVTIEVTEVDEAPMIMVGGLAISGDRSVKVEEGSTAVATYTAAGPDADMATWTLSGDDAGNFDITAAGELVFKSAPDFENPADMGGDNGYQVTVEADDGTYMDMQDVTVTVTNAEEDGEVTLSTDMLIVGEAVTASVTDPDEVDAATVTWQWARADDAEFTMNVEDIAGATTTASYTPVLADDGKYLRATASYDDGYGADTAEATGPDAVTSNRPPEFDMATDSRDVAENSAADDPVGEPVVASDPDNDDLTYSLSGADATAFSIHNNGQVTVGQGTTLDFETRTTYTVTVTATDPSGETDTIDVTINVTNVGLDTPYDADDSGEIDKSEVLKAINDYLFGEGDEAISKAEVLRLINLYLFG